MMVHAYTAVILAGILMLLGIIVTYFASKSAYESNLKRYQKRWDESKTKCVDEYEAKLSKLENENFVISSALRNARLTNHNLLEDKFNLKKALDIKTASAKGLEISANQWRDATLKQEALNTQLETDHQAEIDRLTKYYQEKLEEEKKHSMDISEELEKARAFGNYPYKSEITMEVSDDNEQLSEE